MTVSEARPESVAEKDLRDWVPFLRLFSAVLGKIEWLEAEKMAGPGWLRELDSNSDDRDEDGLLLNKAQYSVAEHIVSLTAPFV